MEDGKHVEYRVREIKRYIVTRHETNVVDGKEVTGSTSDVGSGQFDNFDTAYQVAYAMASFEHGQLGYDLGDERIQYPKRPEEQFALLSAKKELAGG